MLPPTRHHAALVERKLTVAVALALIAKEVVRGDARDAME